MYERQDSPAALPIYAQVSEVLIREIAVGRLADGQRLPPERQLAAAHQVTVRTLRKSLKILEDKGLLERVQGSGCFGARGGAGDDGRAIDGQIPSSLEEGPYARYPPA